MSISSHMTSKKRSTKSGVGFRFSPTDEELVDHFLMGKILADHNNDENAMIPEIKLCDHEPWELPDLIKKDSNDESCHFFSPCDYKYKGSLRLNRTTKAGFWKSTGKPRNVIKKRNKKVIGTKTYLVFYKRQPKPHKDERTSYILHEYDTIAEGKSKCLVYKLNWDENIDNGESDQMVSSPSNPASQVTVNSSCEESEVGEIMSCIDFGNQSDENNVCGYGESEEEKGSFDFEKQTPEFMTGDMPTWGRLIRPGIRGFEYQNQEQQDDMLGCEEVSKSPNVNEGLEINGSWGHNNGGEVSKIVTESAGISPTFFDQVEGLAVPEDSFYSQLCYPGDCLSHGRYM